MTLHLCSGADIGRKRECFLLTSANAGEPDSSVTLAPYVRFLSHNYVTQANANVAHDL